MITLYFVLEIAIAVAIVITIEKICSYLSKKKSIREEEDFWPKGLKECPFCHKRLVTVSFTDNEKQKCRMECRKCGFSTGIKPFNEAVYEWNTTIFSDYSKD